MSVKMISLFAAMCVALCGCRFEDQVIVLKLSHTTPKSKQKIYFDEISNKKAPDLHGRVVHVRGVLVYEYDEAAIYPFYEDSGFKPVWVHVGGKDSILHNFLLKHDGAIATISGVLDTADHVDKNVYSSLLREVRCVSVKVPSRMSEENTAIN